MLQLKNVSYSIPEKEGILKNITMTIETGETVVVTGPNGGGKTTLAKIIAGVAKATSGKVILDGQDITPLDVTERAKIGVAYAFQQPVRFKGMTTKQLIDLASGRKLEHSALCDALSAVGLCANDYIDREVDTKLSEGEIKRIEIATVMLRDAKNFSFRRTGGRNRSLDFNSLIEVFKKLKEKREGRF